jgi:SAM-dependent methyltransferase
MTSPTVDSSTTLPSASHRATNDVIERIVRSRITASSKVLDFGAGEGHMCQRLGRWFAKQGVVPSERITACEIDPEHFKYPDVNCLRIGLGCDIPVPDNSQDVVMAIEVLEHVAQPYHLIAEASRVLKPGGSIVLSIPNLLNMASRMKFLTRGYGDMFAPPSVAPEDAGRIYGHIMPVSFPYLVYGLERAGFGEISFASDRFKRGALAVSIALWPVLKLAAWLNDRDIRRDDERVWRRNRWLVWRVNQLDMLASRSCIVVARKAVGSTSGGSKAST